MWQRSFQSILSNCRTLSTLHQGTKGATRKQSAIQQHSNCFAVGSVFSAPAILLGEVVVGALAYLESRAANADTLLGDTAFVL